MPTSSSGFSINARPKPPVRVTADTIRSELLGEIEGIIDDVMYESMQPPNFYNMFAGRMTPVSVARAIIDKFTPRLQEVSSIKPGCDPGLWEGYAGWDRAYINKLVDLIGSIVNDAVRYVGNSRKARPSGVRKPRRNSTLLQVRRLKYLREFAELKLVSLDPTRVVGSMTLWTYDVKRRLLTMYVSNSRTGLEVKGTTIRKIDVEASAAKVLRKPEATITELLTASKPVALSIINSLSTKAVVPNGRVNDRTVLLRAH